MEPWSFVHVADIQVGSARSYRFAPAWNENWQTARQQIIDINAELLLVGGDLTRDGNLHDFELEAIKADLDDLPLPYHVVPGNMDTGNKHAAKQGALSDRDDVSLNVTGEQLERFASYFGPMLWSFVHKQVRFSGFYAAAAGTGLAQERQMWQWLEGFKKLKHTRHHVVITHYPLFVDRMAEPNFDITEADQYLNWYFCIDHPHRDRMMAAFKAGGVDIVISGHIHCRKTDVVDGIRFYKAPATCMTQWADRWPGGDGRLGFLRFDVSEDGIESQFVPLKELSSAKGYGPGGHPKPEVRVYPQHQ